jgi:hypothetical protein
MRLKQKLQRQNTLEHDIIGRVAAPQVDMFSELLKPPKTLHRESVLSLFVPVFPAGGHPHKRSPSSSDALARCHNGPFISEDQPIFNRLLTNSGRFSGSVRMPQLADLISGRKGWFSQTVSNRLDRQSA